MSKKGSSYTARQDTIGSLMSTTCWRSSLSQSLRQTSRKAQPDARNPASLLDFEGQPLKRRTENRERNRAAQAPGRPPARGWRSRGMRAEPRQHWGEQTKKNQPRTVGFLNSGGNSEYESAAASRAVKRRSGRGARLSASAGIDPKMFNHHRWPVREMRHELQLAAHAFHVVAQGRQ